MSVLVKGMKMPENCLECAIRSYDSNAGEEYCPFSQIECLSVGRQKDCPLVELPENHGRLVEFVDVETEIDDDTGLEEINVGEMLSAYLRMRGAKPVIEAEGKG